MKMDVVAVCACVCFCIMCIGNQNFHSAFLRLNFVRRCYNKLVFCSNIIIIAHLATSLSFSSTRSFFDYVQVPINEQNLNMSAIYLKRYFVSLRHRRLFTLHTCTLDDLDISINAKIAFLCSSFSADSVI